MFQSQLPPVNGLASPIPMTTADEPAEPGRDASKTGLAVLAIAAVLAAGAIGWKVWDASADTSLSEAAAQDAPLSLEELRERAEDSGDDAQAWQELGFAYFQRGEFADAAAAYERAVKADDDEAVLWSALGEARVMASERDPMPPAALQAFRRSIKLDPRDPRARYFLAVQRDLEGDHDGAIADWLALLAETPPGAPWEADLVRTIEQVGAINEIAVKTRISGAMDGRLPGMSMPSAGLPGPTQEQVAAASAMPPGEQREMAEGMVARLEQRLASDPSNVDGWIMLIRSRMTLGEPVLAKDALDAAIRANPVQEDRLRREAAALGVS